MGDIEHNAYGLYALREFKKGVVLRLCMGKYVGTMLNQNNDKQQLKNLAAYGTTSYIGMHFINNSLYTYYVKNKKLDKEAAKARNRTIS